MTDERAKLDPRLHAYRPDLADQRLKGQVEATRFVEARRLRVTVPCAPLKRSPRHDAPLDTELLHGEVFRVFDETDEGWSWGQNETDSYVGHVPTDALGPLGPPPTHRINALRTFVYPGPDMKLPARYWLSLGSTVAVAGEAETRGTTYAVLPGGEGAIVMRHLQPIDTPPEPDYVAVAERFLGTAYLWGGRTSLGVDCSSLVQLALMTAGKSGPRDTDMQEATLGNALPDTAELKRGDLVFWKGHVAIVYDDKRFIHASGHHMTVVIEPIAEALERIAKSSGPPTSRRRL